MVQKVHLGGSYTSHNCPSAQLSKALLKYEYPMQRQTIHRSPWRQLAESIEAYPLGVQSSIDNECVVIIYWLSSGSYSSTNTN